MNSSYSISETKLHSSFGSEKGKLGISRPEKSFYELTSANLKRENLGIRAPKAALHFSSEKDPSYNVRENKKQSDKNNEIDSEKIEFSQSSGYVHSSISNPVLRRVKRKMPRGGGGGGLRTKEDTSIYRKPSIYSNKRTRISSKRRQRFLKRNKTPWSNPNYARQLQTPKQRGPVASSLLYALYPHLKPEDESNI